MAANSISKPFLIASVMKTKLFCFLTQLSNKSRLPTKMTTHMKLLMMESSLLLWELNHSKPEFQFVKPSILHPSTINHLNLQLIPPLILLKIHLKTSKLLRMIFSLMEFLSRIKQEEPLKPILVSNTLSSDSILDLSLSW
jgi:hypothetical protein